MFTFPPRPSHWQFAPYFHFAEPYPRGVIVAYADSVIPDDEMANAAESLRAAEVEAVRTEDEVDDELQSASRRETASDTALADAPRARKFAQVELEDMSIDEVRGVATALDVPDCGTITDKSELIREILRRM